MMLLLLLSVVVVVMMVVRCLDHCMVQTAERFRICDDDDGEDDDVDDGNLRLRETTDLLGRNDGIGLLESR